MKLYLTLFLLGVLTTSLVGCANKETDALSHDGITLNDSYESISKKKTNLKCQKDSNKFECIFNEENGATKYSFNSDQKLNAIRSYWVSESMGPLQIIEVYQNRFGKATRVDTYKNIVANPNYYWCKDKDCEIYRMVSFETPRGDKCLGDFSEEFQINSKCIGKSFVMYLSIVDQKNLLWFDKNSNDYKNLK